MSAGTWGCKVIAKIFIQCLELKRSDDLFDLTKLHLFSELVDLVSEKGVTWINVHVLPDDR